MRKVYTLVYECPGCGRIETAADMPEYECGKIGWPCGAFRAPYGNNCRHLLLLGYIYTERDAVYA